MITLVQDMKFPARMWVAIFATTLALSAVAPSSASAKSYSSGSHSYSSHSSGGSHSFSSGGGHSFSSSHSSGGSSSHSSSGSKSSSFSSGSGHSYSSGSRWGDTGRHSYTSGKSYSSSARRSFVSSFLGDDRPAITKTAKQSTPYSSGTSFTFDSAAARARKEEASQAKFRQYKDSQRPPPIVAKDAPRPPEDSSYRVQPPPLRLPGGGYSHTVVYAPDRVAISTRPIRIYNMYNPYRSRPWVVYRDPYDSLFWWWLLDRSLDDRAWWAYHHRYDMDPARYQALIATDQQLEARVAQLEAQQAPRDPNYVPPGLDRDLMYSDRYVEQTYSNRPTRLGVIAFWALGVPTALAFTGFFVWLIWFKRWQTAT